MRGVLIFLLCFIFAALGTGCATVSYTSPGTLDGVKIKGANGEPYQLVFIESTGYYILWVVPLASGDISWNSEKQCIEGGFSLFKDHVSLTNLQKAITMYADSHNCDVVDISYNDSDTSYAGPSQLGGILACFGSSSISASAVLVPRGNNTQVK